MGKIKKTILLASLLFLIVGCSSNSNYNAIDEKTLQSSVDTLNNRDSSYKTSYYFVNKTLNEKYSDKYLTSSSQKELLPVGNKPNSELVDYDESFPTYSVVVLGNNSTTYTIENLASKDYGRYYLYLEYFIPSTFAASALIKVDINGAMQFNEANTILLPILYEDNVEKDSDGNKIFEKTRYGDEMSPSQKTIKKWNETGLYESTYSTTMPVVFELNTEKVEITITNLSSDYFYLGKLIVKPVTPFKSYLDVYGKDNTKTLGNDKIKVNAINYSSKNSNDITLANEQTPSASPYRDDRKLINVTSNWSKSGQAITYDVDIDSEGYYPLTFHYYNSNDNFPIYRKIEINGEVQFNEVLNYRFPETGSYYKNITISNDDGEPYYFYFKKGKNTITLTATTEPLLEVYTNLMAIYDDINDFAIEIRKLTGASVDSYRDYKLTEHNPSTVRILKSYKNIILDSRYKLRQIVGNDKSSNALSYFQRMIELVDDFIKEPDDLPLKLNSFSAGDNCLAKLVADTATTLQSSNMVLDCLYLTDRNDAIVGKENASWVSSFYSSLVSLGQTFSSDKYKTLLNEGELNIWSARSQAYNDILQAFADNEFTPNTKCAKYPNGIKINIRQMPSEDNLIYAYAANTVPDLALGINSGRAFEFALRGNAAYPLSDFDDTWEFKNNHWGFTPYYFDVASNMPHGQLMSMIYNDKIYSLPESTSVQLMFTRDDMMSVMGEDKTPLAIPNTWDEVIGDLYTIQSYGSNFYYPASASGSLKGLSTTSQFILQNNGKLLSDDAYTVNLRDDKTYEGLKLLTDLYTIYSLPTEVGSFYNHFRYGTYPIGIGDLSMYLSLKYVAPELLGKWSVHMIPGIKQEKLEDGTYKDLNGDGIGDEISRWFISNGSSAMIFNNSKLIDEAWLFLQWWMSTPIQEKFTEALQSAYGPSVVWFSSNLEAAKSLPIDSNVREVVLEQVKWIIDLQQIPGQYMLERGLSDIWNTVVFGTSSSSSTTSKTSIGEAIDLEKVLMDREIQRKMEEFGYYDTIKGSGTRKYILRDFDWVEACFKNFKENKKGENKASPYCPIN